MESAYSNVELGSPIEIFEMMKAANEDTFPQKVHLGPGTYRDDDGKPWVLPVVKRLEKEMADDPTTIHEYLPILGTEHFSKAATKVLLGTDSSAIAENRTFSVQCLSGTGSIRVGAEFLRKNMNRTVFYSPDPTWGNHDLVFINAGFKEIRSYRYWKSETRGIDLEGFLEDLRNAPEEAVIILHACTHNPTGCDPTHDQWKAIANIIKTKKLFPFFDIAYQGFASGDLENDSWAVRYFVDNGFELLCAQSFAKNFGLYSERVGNLTVVMNNPKYLAAIKSQLTINVRAMYSNPPAHGAKIVTKILTDDKLFEEWKQSIKTMSSRIKEMRKALYTELIALNTPGTWEHIITQVGMFSYTGLTERQVEYLIERHHVYLLKTGRISMCGLNTKNVKYTARAFHDAITRFPE